MTRKIDRVVFTNALEMFDFSGLQDRYGDAIGQGRLHYGSSLAARVSSALSANDGDHTLRRPLRISRIIVVS